MYQHQAEIVDASIKRAKERCNANQLALQMMTTFFQHFPETAEIFAPFDLNKVSLIKFCKVGDALLDAVKHPDYSVTATEEELYRHLTYNVRDTGYYFGLIDAYVATIQTALGNEWTSAENEAWQDTVAGMRFNINQASQQL
ncbi:hypothetical protein SIN8267_01749 [Sinobacterium norvegicum]|uniref:Globin n=1 Tax=Sinobacterium norvegicum TaxID=1641715 RepID=A0ABM9AFW7_9GAMM|nr:globin [Sinobacterium norvegicum]CAH0991640.1 hypothetical protein SIN8267_01749 [Sinobacterium norvegicum]